MDATKSVKGESGYEKPALTRVELVLDEVLTNITCKTGGTLGPKSQNCNPGKDACNFQNPS